MQEREIRLADLVVDVFLKWRIIIVIMLLGGILGYIFGGVLEREQFEKEANAQSLKNSVLEEGYASPILVELEADLTDLQKNNVKIVLDYEEFGRYYNESLLMQIDANNAPTSVLVYQVVTDDETISKRVGRIYKEKFSQGIVEWLIDDGIPAIEASKMAELIIVDEAAAKQEESIGKTEATLGDDAFIRIKIVHIDEASCKQLTKDVLDYLSEEQKLIEGTIGEHKLQLIEQDFAVITDTILVEKQVKVVDTVFEGNKDAQSLRKSFSDKEMQYYTYMSLIKKQELTGESQIVPVDSYKPVNDVEHILTGMITGAFVYMFCFFIAYIFSNKLRINDEFPKGLELEMLGRISCNPKHKGIDKWINSLRYGKKKMPSTEDAIGLAAIAIELTAKEGNAEKVVCVYNDLEEDAKKVAQELEDKLKEKNIEVLPTENILCDAKAMETLPKETVAYLVSKAGKTPYEDVIREAKFFERQNIIVAGVLIIE